MRVCRGNIEVVEHLGMSCEAKDCKNMNKVKKRIAGQTD